MVKYCPTCLSNNRNLQELSSDQYLLLEKILPGSEIKKNAKLCWECMGIVTKILVFCKRAKAAGVLLENYYKNKSTNLSTKSQLCVSKINVLNINLDKTVSVEKVDSYSECFKDDIEDENLNGTEKRNVIKEINNKKKVKSDKSNYKCGFCNKLFKTRGTYEYHRQKHKRKPECKKCNLTFISKSLLWTHNNVVHKKVKSYKCTLCKRLFFTEIGYQTHLAKHSTGQAVYYCKECDKFYKNNSSYLKHKRTSIKHYDPKIWKYECTECNRKFQNELNYKKHYEVSHLNIKNFNCKLCEKKYSSARSLNYHIKIKHKQIELPKNKMCHICGKAFKSSQILSTHTRTHSTTEKVEEKQ